MTVKREEEHKLLGCTVRVTTEGEAGTKARKAIRVLENQINDLKSTKPGLKDLDIAVLAALNLALRGIDLETDFRDAVLSLKADIQDAIEFVGPETSSHI